MTDLHDRLREAGRLLDEQAPVFDAATIVARRADDGGAGDRSAGVQLDGDMPASRRRVRPLWLLAVAAVLIVVIAGAAVLRSESNTVTTGPAGPDIEVDDGSGEPAPSAIRSPDVVEVDCAGSGTTLSTTTVRPQPDGVHVVVHNPYPEGAVMDLGGLGGRGVPPGDSTLVESMEPGPASVACQSTSDMTGAQPPRFALEVVDADGLWRDPSLGCAQPSASFGPDGVPPDAGPYRSTPDEAIRSWARIEADTPVRVVGYPDESMHRRIATLPEGGVLFGLVESDDGRWAAAVHQWCTPAPPMVDVDPDPVAVWYDAERIGQIEVDLARLGDRQIEDGPNDIVTAATYWCADVSLQSRLLGDVATAPDASIDQRLRDVVRELSAAVGSCPQDEAAVAADGAFTETDEHLAEAMHLLGELRAQVDARR